MNLIRNLAPGGDEGNAATLRVLPLALSDSSDSFISTCQHEFATCFSASSCNRAEVRLAHS